MPTPRLLRLALLLGLLLPIALLRPGLTPALLAGDVVLLGAFAFDLLRARGTRLAARRRLPSLLFQGAPAQVSVELEAPGVVRVQLREALHPALAPAPLRAELSVAGAAAWSYELLPRRRGTCPMGPLTGRVIGPWGLAASQRELLPPARCSVYPQVRWEGAVGRLLVLAQRRQLGRSPMRHRGAGSETYGVREYRAGDPLAKVHWKATARHGRMLTREEAWERGVPLVILLDCGRAMHALEDSGRSKLDHALAAALALLRVAHSRGDSVSVIAFSDRVERVVRVSPSGSGTARAYAALYDLAPRMAEPAYDAAAAAVGEIARRRSTVLLFTSVVDLAAAELLREALSGLRRRHRVVLLNMLDPELDRLAREPPADVVASFAMSSALDILLENRSLARRLRRGGIDAVATPADRLAWDAISSWLRLTQRGARGSRLRTA
jgi:uncharacterized protein (DUF58 family)